MLIDAHCHLEHLGPKRATELLAHLSEKNLEAIVASAPAARDWSFYADLERQFSCLKMCYGIHPLEITPTWEEDLEQLREFLPRAVAIGEIGLDFHGIFNTNHITEIKLQMKVFERQLRLAKRYHLPVVIHCREAFFAIKAILAYTQFDLKRVLFHCFVENLEAAQWILSQDGMISYSGILTFKKPGHTHETAASADLSQILIETDSPYLAPVPFRGKTNSPEYVHYVAQTLADIKKISYDDCVMVTAQNTHRFFRF